MSLHHLRRPGSALLALTLSLLGCLVALGAVVGVASPARADTAPEPGTPTTVSADALPTWQVNGIVWSQVLVGNTVYATGNFTRARPPGVGVGGAGEVVANNIFAYDVRTGVRVAAFNHSLNGVGQFITKSPDGSRVYVGGDFTTVDGLARGHVAAFNTADNSLVASFAPNVASRVSGIAVSGDTVWVGGNFFNVNGSSRNRLAALRVSNGTLLPWAPVPDGTVASLTLSPDGTKVVVGGRFNNLAGAAASGMGAVDAVTGAPLPFAANQTIRNGGEKSSITSLRTVGNTIYGSGWAFGTGNFEGSFSVDGNTGAINFLNDCHGDTYDQVPVGDVLYNVSHVHNCNAVVGGFPESNPRNVNMQHASAYTNYAATVNRGPDEYGWNFDGVPAAKMLQWHPDLAIGNASGQAQAGWTIDADDRYVVVGGEFPSVNGTAQQGLVRFAVRDLATNKRGPRVGPGGATTATSMAMGGNSVRVAWQAPWDMDNETLTYEVFRNGTAAPVFTTTGKSNFWTLPKMGFRDSGLPTGASYRYTVRVSDPSGNLLSFPQTPAVTVTGGGGSSAYVDGVVADGASAYWRLGEASGPAVYDWARFNDATAGAGVTRGTPGAIGGTTDTASSFSGDGSGLAVSPAMPMTASFAVETWIKTSSTSGGKIVGYGGSASGASGSYDRHLYMTNDGRVVFGVYPGGVRTLTSGAGLNDDQWHQVVGVLDATDGMSLWIDGKRVGSDASTRSGQDYSGYWRIGGDNLNGWPSQPASAYFNGSIDDVSVYPTGLTRTQIQRHYTDSGRTLAGPAAPTDTYGKAVVQDEPSLYWRLGDSAGSTSAADSTGNGDAGVPTAGGITFGSAGGVTGTGDTAATFDGASGTLGSTIPVSNPRAYSEELWFRTTTTQGGKLIGFGSSQTGTSGGYDRHVYMEDSGQLTFGVWTGQTNTITSPTPYNDGQWHHLVASQNSGGMKLYLDGELVGTNGQTDAQDYTGYWRVGGDNAWNGRTYFAGTIDEVAVYPRVLGAADVVRHYQAGGGLLPNQAPTAAFTSATDGLRATFDASGSNDPDGTIVSYAWNFGDAETGTGASPAHTFNAPGTYTVTLTVTDDRGATGTVSQPVTVTNLAPTAAFTRQVDGLDVTTDASGSTDPDGTVVAYAWNWGDGTPTTVGVTASHTYAQPGSYTVTLTVTDDNGANATTTGTVVATTNQAPDAAFVATTNDLAVSVNGTGSSDADGTVASYSWAWGDATPAGSGASATHAYASAGTYTVTLTVTDDRGATGVTTRQVTVAAPAFLARDAFGRTASSTWGDADLGGSWVRTGTATRFAVAGGRGTISLAASSGPWMTLSGVSSTSSDVTVSLGLDKLPTGGPVQAIVRPRVDAAGDNYHADARIQPNGTVAVLVGRKVGTTDTILATVPTTLTYAPGQRLLMRVQAVGTAPTTLRVKIWAAGTTEPATWLSSLTDGAPSLQTAASIGLSGYLSGAATNAPVVVSYDDLEVRSGG
ncbi:PKD domain-containing protein [Nocardioides dongxiaopingii]|uniref:PKD domain-containing protein n=1 Tax=Nocardioides dongxiaopingii TaxID=2576036 RepID=UPI0010C766D1|nr:PKD domain-containing protein [Nocardioides dongxiaopingii]